MSRNVWRSSWMRGSRPACAPVRPMRSSNVRNTFRTLLQGSRRPARDAKSVLPTAKSRRAIRHRSSTCRTVSCSGSRRLFWNLVSRITIPSAPDLLGDRGERRGRSREHAGDRALGDVETEQAPSASRAGADSRPCGAHACRRRRRRCRNRTASPAPCRRAARRRCAVHALHPSAPRRTSRRRPAERSNS